ncbi:MAG TPA: acyloxyacyl hydrolase [Tepidisphaeraceae bacterium]|nr:acyloxyacyl hydrolase [Tepidisphaeraceae bacterium]
MVFLPVQLARAQFPPQPASPDLFAAGTWTAQFTTQYVNAHLIGAHDQFVGGAAGVGYYFTNRFALVADVPVDYVGQNQGADTVAVGFTLLGRWHFLQDGKFSMYLDAGAGALLAGNRVPPGGTNFNFTPQAGLGATYELKDDLFLIGGVRVLHLSNAGIDGIRNPSINETVEGYVGLTFKL